MTLAERLNLDRLGIAAFARQHPFAAQVGDEWAGISRLDDLAAKGAGGNAAFKIDAGGVHVVETGQIGGCQVQHLHPPYPAIMHQVEILPLRCDQRVMVAALNRGRGAD